MEATINVVVDHPTTSDFRLLDSPSSAEVSPSKEKLATADVHAIVVPLNVTASRADSTEFLEPTTDELQTLRKIAGKVPWTAYALCIVEFAERASYYGAAQLFINFLQKPLPLHGNGAGAPPRGTQQTAGALGKGLQFANAFVLLFRFLSYTIPIFGAWIADARIGRYKAIVIGVLICGAARIIQVVGALPSVLQRGQGLAPFIISIFVLAIGAGIFKPNILPTVLDQCRQQQPYVTTLRTGERVIVDPEATIDRITLIFYTFINIGGFFPIASVYAEKRVGFWLAFLLPGIIYFLLPVVLLATYKQTYRVAPNNSVVNDFFRIVQVAVTRNRGRFWKPGFWEAAKPSVLRQAGVISWKNKDIGWTDALVEDVRRTSQACSMFLYFPIWYWNDGGIGSVATSQASSMTTNGAPNDLLSNFNPLTIIVFTPLLTHVIYLMLRKRKMMPGRVTRITFGFTLAWISSICGAVTQWYIYKTSPCGKFATDCTVDTGVSPLIVWWQLPMVMLGAISECFTLVTAYEIAYARAPRNMKAMVMSIFLFMNAISNALAQALAPAIKDPFLTWVWGGPAIACFIVSVILHWRYHEMNDDEFMTKEEVAVIMSQNGDAERGASDQKEANLAGTLVTSDHV